MRMMEVSVDFVVSHLQLNDVVWVSIPRKPAVALRIFEISESEGVRGFAGRSVLEANPPMVHFLGRQILDIARVRHGRLHIPDWKRRNDNA